MFTAKPPSISKTINYMQQTVAKVLSAAYRKRVIESCRLLLTCSTLTNSVMVSLSVAVSEM